MTKPKPKPSVDNKYEELKQLVQDELQQFRSTWQPSSKQQACEFDAAIIELERRLVRKIDSIEKRIDDLEEKMIDCVDRQEQYSRRNCLLLHGIPERQGEDTDTLVLDEARKILGREDMTIKDIDRSHRVGPRRTSAEVTKAGKQSQRPIIVRFTSYRARQMLFQNKKNLKGSGHILTESLTKTRMTWLRQVREVLGVNRVWTADGRIKYVMDEKVYQIDSTASMTRFQKSCESLVKDVC